MSIHIGSRSTVVLTLVVLLSSCSWVSRWQPPLTTIDQQYISVESNLQQLETIDPSLGLHVSNKLVREVLEYELETMIAKSDADNESVSVQNASSEIVLGEQAIHLRTRFRVSFKAEELEVGGELTGLVGLANESDLVVLRPAFSAFDVTDVNATGSFGRTREVLTLLAATAVEHFIDNLNGAFLANPTKLDIGWEATVNSPYIAMDVDPNTSISGIPSPKKQRFEKGVVLVDRNGLWFLLELSSEETENRLEVEIDPSPTGNRYSVAEFDRVFKRYDRAYKELWSTHFDSVPRNAQFTAMVSKAKVASLLEQMLGGTTTISHRFAFPRATNSETIELESNKLDCQNLREPFERTRYRRDSCDWSCLRCVNLIIGEACADEPTCLASRAACNVREEARVAADNIQHETARARHQIEQESRVAGCDVAREAADFLALAKVKTTVGGTGLATLDIEEVEVKKDLSQIRIDLDLNVKTRNELEIEIQPIDLGIAFFCISPYSGEFQSDVELVTGRQSQRLEIKPVETGDSLELRFKFTDIPYTASIQPPPIQSFLTDPVFTAKCSAAKTLMFAALGISEIAAILGENRLEIAENLLGRLSGEYAIPDSSMNFASEKIDLDGVGNLTASYRWGEKAVMMIGRRE